MPETTVGVVAAKHSPNVSVDPKVSGAIASTIRRTADAFDAWLQLNGVADGLARDGRALAVRTSTGMIPGASYHPVAHDVTIRSGALQPGTVMSLSVDVIAHELVHAAAPARRLAPAINEAVADVLALSFARSTGADPDDWRIDSGPGGRVVRDLSKPRFQTAQHAEAHILANSPSTPWYPTHALGDPVRSFAYLLSRAAGWSDADRIIRQALLHELPGRAIGDERDVLYPRRQSKQQTRDLYMAQLQAIADSTLRAATQLFGRGSSERALVVVAWKRVGVVPNDAT